MNRRLGHAVCPISRSNELPMGSDLACDQGAYQIVVWVFEDQRRQITRQPFACRDPSLVGSCEIVNDVQSLSPTTGNDSLDHCTDFACYAARMGASGRKLITYLRQERRRIFEAAFSTFVRHQIPATQQQGHG